MTQKEKTIKKIQVIIEEWGNFSISEVTGCDCPVINCIGKHSVLVETINPDDVDVTEYVDGFETGSNSITYGNLSQQILNEILEITKKYALQQQKDNEQV